MTQSIFGSVLFSGLLLKQCLSKILWRSKPDVKIYYWKVVTWHSHSLRVQKREGGKISVTKRSYKTFNVRARTKSFIIYSQLYKNGLKPSWTIIVLQIRQTDFNSWCAGMDLRRKIVLWLLLTIKEDSQPWLFNHKRKLCMHGIQKQKPAFECFSIFKFIWIYVSVLKWLNSSHCKNWRLFETFQTRLTVNILGRKTIDFLFANEAFKRLNETDH